MANFAFGKTCCSGLKFVAVWVTVRHFILGQRFVVVEQYAFL
jgi:hypothetical protein